MDAIQRCAYCDEEILAVAIKQSHLQAARHLASQRWSWSHAAGPVLVFFTLPSHRATRLSAPTVVSWNVDT
jgi:hypothetical protein